MSIATGNTAKTRAPGKLLDIAISSISLIIIISLLNNYPKWSNQAMETLPVKALYTFIDYLELSYGAKAFNNVNMHGAKVADNVEQDFKSILSSNTGDSLT